MLQHLIRDGRYAVRLLARTPTFCVVAVLTLALGIGANTAIFTVVNAILLRPLPYADADRLVTVWQDLRPRGGPADEWATPGNYADWRRETSIFQSLAVLTGWRTTLTGGAEAEPLAGEQVSHEYFPVLGAIPTLGRGFVAADDVPKARRVAIIADGLWKRRFGGDPSVLGRIITLNGEAHEIVGVLPQEFRPLVTAGAEVWRPLRLDTANPARGAVVLRSVARLPNGLALENAQAAATTLARQLEAAHPEFNEKTGINLIPLHERVVGDIKPGLVALVGAVVFVLLIACANIANLLLARGSARRRELAVRVALGATRFSVIRQLLTESIILALAGGVIGLVLAAWAVDALVAMAPANAPRVGEIGFDRSVFGFAAVLTIGTGILFGIAPALQLSRGHVIDRLRDGVRSGGSPAGSRVRRTLIVAETALALVLLTGAALLLQTFISLRSADLGFDPRNVLVGFVNPPRTIYDTMARHVAYYDQVIAKTAALPGVRSAALASVLPLGGDSDTSFAIEGAPPARIDSETPVTWYRLVSANYFETMGMPLRRGRGFAAREAAPSAIVNEAMARRYFPGSDPVGRRVRFGGPDDPWFTIIGVVADARTRGAREETRVETYLPYWQFTEPGMNVILKTTPPPAQLVASLKQAVSSIDRNVPLSGVAVLEETVAGSIDQPQFVATLTVAFALLALALAAVGIYGVMAYVVSQRITEIGVRMALGAAPREVFGMVIADGLRLTATGVAIGAIGSVFVARALTSMLFGVRPGDPATLAATAAALVAVAAIACVVPARRATRVDPMVALRAD